MIDLTLAPLWGQFRVCPASLWASEGGIGALWDHFGFNFGVWGWLWIIVVSIWDNSGTGWGRFDVTLGSLCALGGRFGITLGWFLDYLGITLLMFSIWRSVFKNTCFALFFHDFNGSGVNSEPLWGHVGWLWVTLGSFLAYEAEFGSLWNHLGPLWIHFGKFLAAISTYEGDFKSLWVDFGVTLGLLWGHFWRMKVTLDHFGSTLN